MFDIGFWEMAFIGIIALIVIGPERLPGAAHRVGTWVGKSRRMLNGVMADFKQEVKAYDVEQLNAVTDEFKSTSKQFKEATRATTDSLGLKAAGDAIKQSASDLSDSVVQEVGETKQVVEQAPVSVSKKTPRKPVTKAGTRKKTTTRKSSNQTTIKKSATTKKNPKKSTKKTLRKKALKPATDKTRD